MAKLKLRNLSNIGDVLTCEELKHIYGREGSGSGSYIDKTTLLCASSS